MATAAQVCVAEVEELVDLGKLNPDHVHLSGAYVTQVYVGHNYQKPIEQKTLRHRA